ncbi:MAG: hypothetical protein ACRDNB_00625 [Gaiellaceae bacterium]
MRTAVALLLALVVAVPALADEREPFVRTCSSSAFGDLGRGWRENAVVAGHLAFVGLGGRRQSFELDRVDPGRANPLKVLVVVDPNSAPTLTIARVSRRNAALGYNAIRHDGSGRGVPLADGTTSVRFRGCRPVRSREPWNRGTQFPGYFLVARRGCVHVEVSTQGKILRRTLPFGVARCAS